MTGWRPRLLAGLAALAVLLGISAVVASTRDDGSADDLETAETTTTATSTTEASSSSTSASSSSTTSSTSTSTTAATSTTGSKSSGTAPAPPTPTTAAPADPTAGVRIRLSRVATVDYPIAMAVRPSDGSTWIARKSGFVCRLSGGTCSESVKVADVSTGGEQGLLGLTFSPAGNRLFLSYTNPAGDTRVDVRTTATSGGLGLGSPTTIFSQDQPEANHNGGNIVFGPDGYLYLGLGDGGGGGDQHGPIGNAQNPGTNLGKVLRINPSSLAVQRWIMGVRNPWRFSFDRANGDLWLGDVGQGAYEEVDYLPAGAQSGRNLGWRCYEGNHVYTACSPKTPSSYVAPIYEYGHATGCAVTGGYVYRGSRVPTLRGLYLFSDYCDGKLRVVAHAGRRLTRARDLGMSPGNVVSFGQDAAGELYVLTPSAIFRVDPA